MSVGNKFKARLFLEGREVPFVSATIAAAEGQPTSISLELVPQLKAKFLRARTQVHLFVQDQLNFGDLNFYLAFEGEVTGKHYSRRESARAISYGASDYSIYWDQAKSFFYNPQFLVGMMADSVRTAVNLGQVTGGNAAGQTTTTATIQSEMIRRILLSKDIVVGVATVIKNMLDINIFFKSAWKRLRIPDRINIFTSGKIAEFLKDLQIEQFLTSFVGAQGGMISLRETLYSVMGLIFHTFISVPFPAFVDVKGTNGSTSKTISNFLFVPDGYSLPPPTCNVLFPNQIIAFDLDMPFNEITRYMFKYSLPETSQQNQDKGAQFWPAIFYPTAFNNFMTKNSTKVTISQQDELKGLLGPSTLYSATTSFEKLYYGQNKDAAVDAAALSPVLRQADFLTNEESLRGVFYEMENFPPAITALANKSSAESRLAFFQRISKYLFFKKRFSQRPGSASLIFSPYLVPGFNTLFVDDSTAGQTVIAKLQTITHVISPDTASTSISFGYGRDFDEVDLLTGDSGEPQLPEWFDSNIFGAPNKALFDKETKFLQSVDYISDDADPGEKSEVKIRDGISSAVCFPKLNQFYQQLLGCDAVTFNDKTVPIVSLRGAATYLTERYNDVSGDHGPRDAFVFNFISRPLVKMVDAFRFLGAEVPGGVIPEEFAYFKKASGKQTADFDGISTKDDKILSIRREIIDQYISALKTNRGFRG